MGPHSFNAIYSARSGDVLRRNAMLLPLYSLVLLLVFFAGFAALLIVPGLQGHRRSTIRSCWWCSTTIRRG